MKIRVLLLTTACALVAGLPALSQAQTTAEEIRALPTMHDFEILPGYSIEDGPPPEHVGDYSNDPEEILTQSSDETMERIANHFKKTYGTEAGPIAALEEKERQVEAARRKVAVYNMTPEERQAYYEEQRALNEPAPQQQMRSTGDRKNNEGARPWVGYGVNKKPATPPRLFNNAQ